MNILGCQMQTQKENTPDQLTAPRVILTNTLRRHQTDAENFYEKIEIGECPNLVADIKVIDESPFFVGPFPLSETDKPFMCNDTTLQHYTDSKF